MKPEDLIQQLEEHTARINIAVRLMFEDMPEFGDSYKKELESKASNELLQEIDELILDLAGAVFQDFYSNQYEKFGDDNEAVINLCRQNIMGAFKKLHAISVELNNRKK